MNNSLKKMSFLALVLFLYLENVYALTIELEEGTVLIAYLFCGIFILMGIVLIIVSKLNGRGSSYKEEKKEADKLIDKNLKNDKKEDSTLKNTFNPDSIYQVLPSFSLNNFFDKISDDLEKDITDKNNVKDLKLDKKIITNFQEFDEKYVIESKFTFDQTVVGDDGKDYTSNVTYDVIANNFKEKDNFQRCPTCGGKIKDITMLRCEYCGSILPKLDNSKANIWTIEKYELEPKE